MNTYELFSSKYLNNNTNNIIYNKYMDIFLKTKKITDFKEIKNKYKKKQIKGEYYNFLGLYYTLYDKNEYLSNMFFMLAIKNKNMEAIKNFAYFLISDHDIKKQIYIFAAKNGNQSAIILLAELYIYSEYNYDLGFKYVNMITDIITKNKILCDYYFVIFNEPEIALKYATNADTYTYFRRGLIFEELKDYMQMEINLKLADGIKEANYILGKYYENQSNILKMNDHYEQGIKLNSKKCLVSLVNYYYSFRNYDKFKELCKKYINVNPSYIYNSLGDYYLYKKKNYSKAIHNLLESYKIDDNNYKNLCNLGYYYQYCDNNNLNTEMIKYYTKAVINHGCVESLRLLNIYYTKADNLDILYDTYKIMCKYNIFIGNYYLYRYYFVKKNYNKCLKYLKKMPQGFITKYKSYIVNIINDLFNNRVWIYYTYELCKRYNINDYRVNTRKILLDNKMNYEEFTKIDECNNCKNKSRLFINDCFEHFYCENCIYNKSDKCLVVN